MSTSNISQPTKELLKAKDEQTDPSQETEDEILQTALHGPNEGVRHRAIEALLEREYDWLRRIAMLLAKESELGGDALQDALYEIARSLPRFRKDSSLRTWMFVIVRRSVQKLGRKRWLREARFLLGREKDVAERTDGEDEAQTPDRYLLERESQQGLWSQVQKLPEKQRLSVILFYGEELSVSEIAAALSCSESSVKTHLSRAREKLKDSLSEDFQGAASPINR